MQRRGFLAGILAAGFAPAAIGSGVLMPVRAIWVPPEPSHLQAIAEMMRQANKILEDCIWTECNPPIDPTGRIIRSGLPAGYFGHLQAALNTPDKRWFDLRA